MGPGAASNVCYDSAFDYHRVAGFLKAETDLVRWSKKTGQEFINFKISVT
jgi:hypothetical protein